MAQPPFKSRSGAQFAGLTLLALAIAGVVVWQGLRWRKVEDTAAGMVWERGHVRHFDRNRDGLVEEEVRSRQNGDRVIARDLDGDGWFDVQYELRGGLARNLRTIREAAPRH